VEEKKLPQRLVRDAGVFYVCHRLSQMGWNARPSIRYAKGPNVAIDSEDGERAWRVKVRSFSKRAPVPLGKDPAIDADWVVCTRVRTDSPECYVMTSAELSGLTHRDSVVTTTGWSHRSTTRRNSRNGGSAQAMGSRRLLRTLPTTIDRFRRT
jgi:hypothetical protein